MIIESASFTPHIAKESLQAILIQSVRHYVLHCLFGVSSQMLIQHEQGLNVHLNFFLKLDHSLLANRSHFPDSVVHFDQHVLLLFECS